MKHLGRIGCAWLAVALMAGCASTEFTSTWSDPQAAPIRFDRTLAVFMSSEEGERRRAEDRLVAFIGPQRSAPSYGLLTQAELVDTEAAKAKVRAAGFDGVVVMRVVGQREQTTYVPPTYYRSYWGYYNRGWNQVYEPGYLRTDTIVSMETNVYSLADDRLLWSGVSQTFEPADTAKMVDEVAEQAAKEMRRQGLLPQSP